MSTFSLKDHQSLRSEGHVQREEQKDELRRSGSSVLGCDLASHKGAQPRPSAVEAWRWDDLAQFIAVLLLFHLLKACQAFSSPKTRKN